MKLLIVTNNPNRASFRQRIGIYLETLKQNGIKCEIAVLPSDCLSRYKLFKKSDQFDGVFLHKKCLNPIDAYNLKKHCRKLIFNYDDAIMHSDKNPDQISLSHLLPFRRTAKMADMIIVGSPYLAAKSEKLNTNVKILPIGINTDEYISKKNRVKNDKICLVWIGSESTLSYLYEIKPVLEEIGKRFANVTLRIIGDTFFDLENMSVEKMIWGNDTKALNLATSDIGLGPLLSNPFTEGKCSFKILEYSCSGLPVVASPVGTNTVFVKNGITGFLVKNQQQWIDKICQLIKDPQLRFNMGQAGIVHAQNFDVKIIGQKFTELISDLLK